MEGEKYTSSGGWAAMVTLRGPNWPHCIRYLCCFAASKGEVWDDLLRVFGEEGESRRRLQSRMRGSVKLVRAKIVAE